MLENYRKYKISLNADSKKVQGLQVGDIVRRQYFDGGSKQSVYSLMCVLAIGSDRERNDAGILETRPYFIGALLEGDEPKSNELLDFARITSLFNTSRSGALYLTASDDQAPYMDVVDAIGKNASVSWPESVASDNYQDSQSQYVIKGKSQFSVVYTANDGDQSRVVRITRRSGKQETFEGLAQDFYQNVTFQHNILVSYKIRSNAVRTLPVSIGYIDGVKTDASWTENVSPNWEYKFRVVRADASGRHLRTFHLDLGNLPLESWVEIADFNIILQDSIANFGEGAAMRIGKLDGVADSVYGNLKGYGAYLQKLFISKSAHISGTLTAGDENGFASTFYAGRIHRNVFVNSIDISFVGSVDIDGGSVQNPTGMGHVYRLSKQATMTAQTNEWLTKHAYHRYCFSVYVYAKCNMTIGIQQNGKNIRTIAIPNTHTHKWTRINTDFNLQFGADTRQDLQITLVPTFNPEGYNEVNGEANIDEKLVYITAPQLEVGEEATQYQPTDDVLEDTDDYGAWFARGGIGGTIQNPLLRLNYDGKGGIGSRTRAFALNQDGSGYLANGNIAWDTANKVTLGKDVTLTWDNLDQTTKDNMVSRYFKIIGKNVFTIIGQGFDTEKGYSPASITLGLEEIGFKSTSSQRTWYFEKNHVWVPKGNGETIMILPDTDDWSEEDLLNVKCEIMFEDKVYADVFTVRRQYAQGYTVLITSSQGTVFKNGHFESEVKANVYYNGTLIPEEEALQRFDYIWKIYRESDPLNETHELDEYFSHPSDKANTLSFDASIAYGYLITCEIDMKDYFDYSFPLSLGDAND